MRPGKNSSKYVPTIGKARDVMPRSSSYMSDSRILAMLEV